ncbi:alpha/beta hydrolase fold-domain-containing protein [Syncephalis plumigaleata]|nr:alpha/beta hydrolase fold-domain-containing protein [Syncephalis plumigaleata]
MTNSTLDNIEQSVSAASSKQQQEHTTTTTDIGSSSNSINVNSTKSSRSLKTPAFRTSSSTTGSTYHKSHSFGYKRARANSAAMRRAATMEHYTSRHDPEDISFCSTVAAPTRIQTLEELEGEKVVWRVEDDEKRRHVPRNLATTFMHMATIPAVVAARRLTNRSRNPGWSFRDEAVTTWLHFSLGTSDFNQWRKLMWMGKVFGRVRAGSKFAQKVEEPDISGYWFDEPEGLPIEQKDIVWLYFHGGGYIAGDPMMHVSAFKHLLRSLRVKNNIRNVRLLAVKYPLAPEHYYPSQVNIAFSAYRWLINVHKTPSSKIIVGGDSAGGNLSLALLQRIRDEQLPMPSLCVLMSPWVEMLLSIPQGVITRPQLQTDILSVRSSRPVVLAYLGESRIDPADPIVSPVNMDFTGMPPMVVQWGGKELFAQQIREFCSRAENAGIQVLRDADPDMSHTYQMLLDLIGSRSARGLDRLAAMIARMVVNEMGSDGQGGGPGPRKSSPLPASLYSSLHSSQSAISTSSSDVKLSNQAPILPDDLVAKMEAINFVDPSILTATETVLATGPIVNTDEAAVAAPIQAITTIA